MQIPISENLVDNTVDIVALSARTPVGLSAETTAAAIRADIRRIREHPFHVNARAEPLACASDARIDPSLFGVPRLLQLAAHALDEIVQKVEIADGTRIPVFLAMPEVRPGFTAADSASLARSLSRSSPKLSLDVRALAEGHAGGLHALQLARDSVLKGDAAISIAGGVDSYLDRDALAWLEAERRVARPGTRGGFPPGEGAVMVAVARARHRSSVLGILREVACAYEPVALDSNVGTLGEGLTTAVQLATRAMGAGNQIANVYGDINGERHRNEEWGFTLLRCPEIFRDGTQYVSSVSQCGEIGAATAILGTVLAVRAWHRGYAAGPLALVWAGSWAGMRGAALLERAA